MSVEMLDGPQAAAVFCQFKRFLSSVQDISEISFLHEHVWESVEKADDEERLGVICRDGHLAIHRSFVPFVYKHLSSEFRTRFAVSADQHTEGLFGDSELRDLSAGLCVMNADLHSVWNFRFQLVRPQTPPLRVVAQKFRASPPHHSNLSIEEELHFSALVLKLHPKSGEAWAYRQQLLDLYFLCPPCKEIEEESSKIGRGRERRRKSFVEQTEEEIHLVEEVSQQNEQHYYSWRHWRWLLGRFREMLKRDPPPAQRRGVAEDEFLQHGGTEGGKLGAGTEIENKFDCGDVKAAIDCMTTSLDACLFKTPSHFGVFHHRLSLCRYELLVLEAHFEQHIKEGAEGVGWAQEQKNTQEEKILRSVCDKASSLLSLFPGVESVWEFFAALVPLRLLLPLRASVKAREKAKSQSSGEVCYTVCVAREDGHLWKRFAEIAKETAELVQRCFGDDTRATTQSMQRVASVADARGGEGEEGRASRETRSRDFCSRIVVSVLETFEDICEQIGGVPLEFSSSGVGGRPSGGWEGGGGAERPRADHTCKRSGQNSTEGLESSDAQETVAAAELRETVDGLAAFLKLGPRVEESQILS